MPSFRRLEGNTSMAQVLLATVTAPKGPPCNVRQMANMRIVPAAMYPAKKTVYHIAAKWAHDKGCHGVAAQYDAYGVFGGSKSFAQIEGQERGEEIEGEVQQKVCCHHLDIIGIPEFLLLFIVIID